MLCCSIAHDLPGLQRSLGDMGNMLIGLAHQHIALPNINANKCVKAVILLGSTGIGGYRGLQRTTEGYRGNQLELRRAGAA